MTKSEIFKDAHKLAKSVVAIVGDYMVALAYSLKKVYADMKNTSFEFANFEARAFDLDGTDFDGNKYNYGATWVNKTVKSANKFAKEVAALQSGIEFSEDEFYFELDELEAGVFPSDILKSKAHAEKCGYTFNF
ncbi:hypothetical protein [Shewanella halifaxensis]|uniref:hypothetical protein n=1 Tax=Shewanella halifaxensis TaxID=271098 RepID=UPI000D59F5B3|nr:hypothetical protein [Shewanella halifaxensis]